MTTQLYGYSATGTYVTTINSTGDAWTIGGTGFTYITSPTKEPMLENQTCPLCNSAAVRDSHGRDHILHALKDNKPPTDTSACRKDEWSENGVVLRVRCCASCGNIWASRTAPAVEVPCKPGK